MIIITEAAISPSFQIMIALFKLSVSLMYNLYIAQCMEAIWQTVKVEILNPVAEPGNALTQPKCSFLLESHLCTSVAK